MKTGPVSRHWLWRASVDEVRDREPWACWFSASHLQACLPVSVSLWGALKFGFLIDGCCQGVKDRGSERQGSLLCRSSVGSHLLLIYNPQSHSGWQMMPLTQDFNFRAEKRPGWRSGSRIQGTNRGKMPVYRIAFVSTLSSDIAPTGTARMCAARAMI